MVYFVMNTMVEMLEVYSVCWVHLCCPVCSLQAARPTEMASVIVCYSNQMSALYQWLLPSVSSLTIQANQSLAKPSLNFNDGIAKFASTFSKRGHWVIMQQGHWATNAIEYHVQTCRNLSGLSTHNRSQFVEKMMLLLPEMFSICLSSSKADLSQW